MKRVASKKIAINQLKTWAIAETLLPEYTPDQYHDLEEFLAKGGELAPIVVTNDAIIIDGYNRWRLATQLQLEEIECDVYEYNDEAEMEMHAIVLNSKRRHLNKLQVARAAVRLASLETDEDNEDDNNANNAEEVAETPVVEIIQADILIESEPEIDDNNSSEDSEEQSSKNNISEINIKHVAKKLGIPQSTVKHVNQVDNSCDRTLINAMEEKIVTIKQAAEIAEMAADKRQEAIEQYDLERLKRNSVSAILTKSCDNFRKRLKNQKKKLIDAELTQDESDNLKEQMHQVILESQSILESLNSNS